MSAVRKWALAGVSVTLLVTACTGGADGGGAASTSSATTSPAGPASASPTSEPSPTSRPFRPAGVRLELEPFAAGLEAPLLLTNAGDGSGRAFVVEQSGRIRIVQKGHLRPSPFLDISDRIVSGGEQGLLGLAFHPDFSSNGRFFVDYTDLNGDTVVAEFHVSAGAPNRADPGSERMLLGFDQPAANHNGGDIAFGPDGYLYVASGDGGSEGDPNGYGQRLDTLLGKLLRIDVDHRTATSGYVVPPDNPFVGRAGARPAIWALGLRNPWRFSFDRGTGDLWIGDVGQGTFEEIDHVVSNRAGLNYGWKVMEGRSCYEPNSGCDMSGLTLPVAVYDHGHGCSVTGGYVYRGSRWPALQGAYLFADYCSGTIWSLDGRRPSARPPVVMLETGRAISSFGEDESGELYVTDLGQGEVLRIVAPSP
jgi:glucose/arabinose dehydrogenase